MPFDKPHAPLDSAAFHRHADRAHAWDGGRFRPSQPTCTTSRRWRGGLPRQSAHRPARRCARPGHDGDQRYGDGLAWPASYKRCPGRYRRSGLESAGACLSIQAGVRDWGVAWRCRGPGAGQRRFRPVHRDHDLRRRRTRHHDRIQTVIGIQGRPIAAAAPTNQQVLAWNSLTGRWTPSTVVGGSGPGAISVE